MSDKSRDRRGKKGRRPPRGGMRDVVSNTRVAIRLLLRADARVFKLAVLLQVVGALSATGVVVAGKLVLDALGGLDADVQVSRLVLPVILLAVTSALASSASVMQVQQGRLLGEAANRDIWRDMLAVSSRVDLQTYELPDFYNRLDRVANNAVRQPVQMALGVLNMIGGLIGAVMLMVVLGVIEPMLLVPLLLGAGPALYFARRSGVLEFAFVRDSAEIYRRRSYFRELMARREPAKEVRAFGLSLPLERFQMAEADRYLGLLRPHVRRRQRYALGTVLTTASLLSAGLLLLMVFLNAGWLTFSEAGAAAIGIRMLSSQLAMLFSAMNLIAEASVFVADLTDFLTNTPVEPEGTGEQWPLDRGVSVTGVTYRYPEAEADTLRGVDLDIRPGEIVALVGENGSGKTTLAKIVAGLYPPSGGSVLWDDESVDDEHSRLKLRASVAVIFQDFVHYQLPLRENVAFGDATRLGEPHEQLDADVSAALVRSGADFDEFLPAGLDTLLSREFTGGVELSLGQWQRIALARALFRAAPLVVLDEPSSALDPRSEYELFSTVRELLNDRAGLLVSHRYANLHLADRIYVMQDGRVVEHGSHEELMRLDGVYGKLYRLQADAYDVSSPRGAAGTP